jgi:uncharacterized protein involved in oxidation of intracellular sulfur
MKSLFILNEGPYGSEKSYNALRVAGIFVKHEDHEVKVFLIGEAASCAKAGQKVPQGYFNIEIMLKNLIQHQSEIGICATCMDARGITDEELVVGTKRSTLEELRQWTLWADKVMTF